VSGIDDGKCMACQTVSMTDFAVDRKETQESLPNNLL